MSWIDVCGRVSGCFHLGDAWRFRLHITSPSVAKVQTLIFVAIPAGDFRSRKLELNFGVVWIKYDRQYEILKVGSYMCHKLGGYNALEVVLDMDQYSR